SPSSKGVSGAKPQSRIFASFLGESKKEGRGRHAEEKSSFNKKMKGKNRPPLPWREQRTVWVSLI
ncbi:MAG: hypothetical protein FWC72_07075, partial [Oscillospiraceae bacterium]|nr:hypothetical protein [Oscillospiraceae bacterium]